MRNLFFTLALLNIFLLAPSNGWAKRIQVDGTTSDERQVARGESSEESDDSPTYETETPAPSRNLQFGEKAARKHFVRRSIASEGGGSVSPETHYLAVDFGTYVSSSSWVWDGNHIDNPGRLTFGVTYRVGEWAHSMDLNFRGDFSTYNLPDGNALKFSLLPLITFPDAGSKFPLYFGVGAGLGVYFQQIQGQQGSSPLSFDYQLVAGARFFNLSGSTGFLVEGGIKNSLHLTNSGQFNGAFAAIGAVFTF